MTRLPSADAVTQMRADGRISSLRVSGAAGAFAGATTGGGVSAAPTVPTAPGSVPPTGADRVIAETTTMSTAASVASGQRLRPTGHSDLASENGPLTGTGPEGVERGSAGAWIAS